MGRGDHVLPERERRAPGRLFGEHVEDGPAQLTPVQRLEDRGLVHQTPSGRVHEHGAARKAIDLARADHPLGFRREGNVQGEDLRARQ